MREDINLGRKLTEAHANMGKIALRTLLRVLVAGVIILAGVRSNPPGKPVSILAGALVLVMIVVSAIWVFYPLIHCREYMTFYENGIEFCGRRWCLDELGQISFMESKSNYSMFARTYMCTEVRKFDVTYIKDGKKNFNRAYFDTI